ncbi:MAG: four helix bundle protein [Candidatus Levybacteria bacterium]|nr:four helix bundle protein [Candidatus Levybacteria bacterium]MBI2196008.1 four helix bundle protein [Candidatus Daviesbacteria bacterium]MBI2622866.1 four helix bundle protein [Candidatus Levybacteria bacterium]MBI3070469.1 four helix bundle protein [Candidatus Levybacteria bacterium]MBI3093107.1 four helix bundle protein [Candidatus Levybacteria bacterium]
MESKGSWGSKGRRGHGSNYKAGYEYLLAYKISVPIYDYTVIFCKRYRNLLSSNRTFDQMVQASRSGTTNIPEGNQQASLEGYIKLTGVNRASLEELLKDYLSFTRQNNIPLWGREETVRRVREVGEVWEILKKTPTLPDYPNFPNLPDNLPEVVNLMITLVNQAIYLQKRLQQSLEQKFVEKGGFRENLFQKRNAYSKSRKP